MVEIRTAYRRAALRAHPDKDGGSTEAFHAVTFAFDILSCHSTRKCYDRVRLFHLDRTRSAYLRRGTGVHSKQRLIRKRPASHSTHATAKRFCGANGKCGVAAKPGQAVSITTQSLEHLQRILQSMPANNRQFSISTMPKHVQKVLLRFMEDDGRTATAARSTPRKHSAFQCKKKGALGGSKLRPYRNTYGRTYSAQVDIGFLRIYTSGHRDIEIAIERQVILSQIRDVLYTAAEADRQVWSKTGKIEQMIHSVIQKNGASEQELGLRACVQMRATEYVERKYVMTSPVMSFRKVVPFRNRILCARRESWDTFREQWIKWMRSTRNARSKRLSQEEAENICDQARKEFLEKQLALALRNTERLLKAERQKAAKMSKASVQEKHRQLRDYMKGETTNDDARREWKDRMQLFLQRDLSEDELHRFCQFCSCHACKELHRFPKS